MRRWQGMLFGGVVVLSFASAVAAEEPKWRSEWSGSPPGAWRVLRYSSQWGQQPPFTQLVRQTRLGFESSGRANYRTEVLGGDEGDVSIPFALETQTPEDAGLELQGAPVSGTVELLNRKLPVRISTYEGTDWTDYRVRVTIYESDEVSLFHRGLAQWQVDSGYTLGPRVVKATSERFTNDGTSLSIEQELVDTDVPIDVGGRTVSCIVERSRAYRHAPGEPKGEPARDVRTRWLSSDVPGHLVRAVNDNTAGEIVTLELTDFGGSPPGEGEPDGGGAGAGDESAPEPRPGRESAPTAPSALAEPPSPSEALPVEVDDLQKALRHQWQGAWAVTSMELYSSCDGTFSANPVRGRLVQGQHPVRFAPGELAKVDRVDVRRSRIDVRMALDVPLLLERQDGPFTLYEQRSCETELQIDVDRETVKQNRLAEADAAIRLLLESHATRGQARASGLWNRRERREPPADYDETLARYRAWQRNQHNQRVQARINAAAQRGASYLDRLLRDPQAASAFTAGAASVRGHLPRDCRQLLDLDETDLPGSSVGGVRADEAYAAGQRLAFYLELAQRLGGCFVPVE